MEKAIVNPLVSIVIPVFNGEKYLAKAIESALLQTYDPIEILVINDGSNDHEKTHKAALAFGSKIRYFEKSNGGVASALNLGIQMMRGDFFSWLSHDDEFLPRKTATQVAFLDQHPEFIGCYSYVHLINEEGEVVGEEVPPWYPSRIAIRKCFLGNYFNGCSTLIRRSCFETVGQFNETLRSCQDDEMWLRILSKFEFGLIPEKLTRYRIHCLQGTNFVPKGKPEAQQMYESFFDQLDKTRIFSCRGRFASEKEFFAWAYEWYGDTMARHRRWFDFGNKQYQKSVALFPSWKNPARAKLLLGARFFFLVYWLITLPRRINRKIQSWSLGVKR